MAPVGVAAAAATVMAAVPPPLHFILFFILWQQQQQCPLPHSPTLLFKFLNFYLASISRYKWQLPSHPLQFFQKYYIRIVYNSK